MEKRKFKTTKILSGGRSEYRAWSDWAEGDVLICKLLGSSQNRKNENKKDWIVSVVECFFEDKKEEKRLKPETRLTLNTAGQLDKGMNQVSEGATVQITYNGSGIMEGGKFKGKSAYSMEVVEVTEDTGEAEEATEEDL